jgi:dienelactone hydrolase
MGPRWQPPEQTGSVKMRVAGNPGFPYCTGRQAMSVLHRTVIAPVLLLLSMTASSAGQSSVNITPAGSAEQIPATLIKPPGDGPFPAVVIMHDCSGLGPRSSGAPARWGEELVAQGYVVMIPDSFSTRGFPQGTCLIAGNLTTSVGGQARAADAYGALAALRTLPYVDGRHVGIMGGSHGGWTTLAAMVAPPGPKTPLADEKRDGFAAGIALYPSCASHYGAWSPTRAGPFGPPVSYQGIYQPIAPLLILIGEKDDWTPAEPCRRLSDTSRAAGFPVDIKIYPGAQHSFDSDRPVRFDERRNNINAPNGRGATIGGDPVAWADAKKQVTGFFAQHLRDSH